MTLRRLTLATTLLFAPATLAAAAPPCNPCAGLVRRRSVRRPWARSPPRPDWRRTPRSTSPGTPRSTARRPRPPRTLWRLPGLLPGSSSDSRPRARCSIMSAPSSEELEAVVALASTPPQEGPLPDRLDPAGERRDTAVRSRVRLPRQASRRRDLRRRPRRGGLRWTTAPPIRRGSRSSMARKPPPTSMASPSLPPRRRPCGAPSRRSRWPIRGARPCSTACRLPTPAAALLAEAARASAAGFGATLFRRRRVRSRGPDAAGAAGRTNFAASCRSIGRPRRPEPPRPGASCVAATSVCASLRPPLPAATRSPCASPTPS